MVHALESAGFKIYEATTVLEAQFLAVHENIPAVIIAADFEDRHLFELKRRLTTIPLESSASPEDVIWELWKLLSPVASSAIH